MARHKEPTQLKVLNGNPGKRKLPINEVKPAPIADTCPEWMDDLARDVWQRFAPRLERLGLLTETDTLDFQNLCIAASDVKRHTWTLMSEGFTQTTKDGYLQQRPEVGMRNKAITLATTLSAKFGMSPSDRAGLIDPKSQKQESEMASLLSK